MERPADALGTLYDRTLQVSMLSGATTQMGSTTSAPTGHLTGSKRRRSAEIRDITSWS
jgi:hypothetical protein